MCWKKQNRLQKHGWVHYSWLINYSEILRLGQPSNLMISLSFSDIWKWTVISLSSYSKFSHLELPALRCTPGSTTKKQRQGLHLFSILTSLRNGTGNTACRQPVWPVAVFRFCCCLCTYWQLWTWEALGPQKMEIQGALRGRELFTVLSRDSFRLFEVLQGVLYSLKRSQNPTTSKTYLHRAPRRRQIMVYIWEEIREK